MKLTKLEHACLALEIDDTVLYVDPGSLTTLVHDVKNVAGVVITHAHADHFSLDQLGRLVNANPDLIIIAPRDAAEQAEREGFAHCVTLPELGREVRVGPFTLRFTEGEHAEIFSGVATPRNLGVLINDTLFYPGDALTPPPGEGRLRCLAAPMGAPWMSVGDGMGYLERLRPEIAFCTHDALLSEVGHHVWNGHYERVTRESGGVYHALTPGDTLDL